MTPERWKKLDALFHEAVELRADERSAHLARVCAGDQQLRVEVERLLSAYEQEGSFIDSPIYVEDAGQTISECPDSRVGQSIGPYLVISHIGRGGMGEVYLAEDTRLARRVALKLLPEEYTRDAGRVRRFEQEARAASSLNHPNIVTIHEIGRVDSTHYIVTEFVEGVTLRKLLTEGKLRIGAAVEIVVQVASALAAAHASGIVHRDIKPENVMVRPDGLVKVLDFGLAKLTEPSRVIVAPQASATNSLTEPGQVMGTPHYMSPEQARGVGVDARSDIFSLGVLLYEMIAGRVPFEGATPTDVIISVVQREPESVSRYTPEASNELKLVISKALCKEPAERYQTASEFLTDLNGLKLLLWPNHLRPSSSVQPLRLRNVAIASLIAILLVFGWLWFVPQKPESPAPVIAVLPFKNLSSEPESEYFVDGLTDEIIRNLSLIEGLEVKSQTSSFAFKDKPRNIRDVGEQLKTNFVIEGSVLRSGEKLRINAQFVRISDDVPLWSGRFDLELKDIFKIQDEISRSVVNELRLKLGRGKRRYDTNPETYELYLKARSLLGSTLIPRPNVFKSVDLFEQVIAKDPTFAPAYAGVANAYGAVSIFTGPRAPGQPDREAAFAKMRPAAERALQLDPLLAEAYDAMALVYVRDLDWASAERASRRAIELNSNLTAAYVHLAYSVLLPGGRFVEAIQELDRAIRVDPLSADPWEPRASAFLFAGRYDETIENCRRGLALDPENAILKQLHARALLQQGRATEAIAILQQTGEQSKGQLGYAYAISGRRVEAEALAADSANFPRRRAWIYAGLGDKDRVFEALEEMAARKDPGARLYLVFPEMALIRDDPRLAAFRKKVGLQ